VVFGLFTAIWYLVSSFCVPSGILLQISIDFKDFNYLCASGLWVFGLFTAIWYLVSSFCVPSGILLQISIDFKDFYYLCASGLWVFGLFTAIWDLVPRFFLLCSFGDPPAHRSRFAPPRCPLLYSLNCSRAGQLSISRDNPDNTPYYIYLINGSESKTHWPFLALSFAERFSSRQVSDRRVCNFSGLLLHQRINY